MCTKLCKFFLIFHTKIFPFLNNKSQDTISMSDEISRPNLPLANTDPGAPPSSSPGLPSS